MTEMEWLDIFADNLYEMLCNANMSQKELADRTGMSEASISAYLNGRKLPGLKAIVNIAMVLDCSVGDLVDFGDMIF